MASQCLVNSTNVDPFTLAIKRTSARPGNTLKLTYKIQNAIEDGPDIESTFAITLPAGVSYRRSKINALPDANNGPKGTKKVPPTVAGPNVTWNPFIIPANQTRPRTAHVWVRIARSGATFPLTFAGTISDLTGCTPGTAGSVSVTPVTVRAAVVPFGTIPQSHPRSYPSTPPINHPQVTRR